MLHAVYKQFYSGPNPWWPTSGLLMDMEFRGDSVKLLDWHPTPAELTPILDLLGSAMPAASASIALTSPQHICATGLPIAALMLATAEIMVRDYCVDPCMGDLLYARQHHVGVFLPCDGANTGKAAWSMSMQVASSVQHYMQFKQPEPIDQLANVYREVRLISAKHSLNPSSLALARASRAQGIPYYRVNVPGQIMQLGQGRYQKRIMECDTEETGVVKQPLSADRDSSSPVGKIPTVGITGSIGKTTTCRLVARMLSESGQTVAMSTTQGAWVGQDTIKTGDVAGGRMARTLLLDPRTDAGVFEFARGGLLKFGLVLDALDVGAVLNVLDNHIGIDDIKSRADLARIKRLVVQNARHMAVLNADDPLCLAMRQYVSAPKLALVGTSRDNPVLRDHQAAGGIVAFLEGQGSAVELKLYEAHKLIVAMAANEMPATLDGSFLPTMLNALFAMTIAHGLGIGFPIINSALRGFRSDHESNPGRMNFVEGLPYRLLITWADGPQATGELARYARSLTVQGRKRIVITSVGNRPDHYIMNVARSVAGEFTDYICADWEDLRGRPAGAVATLLANGLRESGVMEQQISIAPTHDVALDTALADTSAGDFLMLVTYSGEKAWKKAMDFQQTLQANRAL